MAGLATVVSRSTFEANVFPLAGFLGKLALADIEISANLLLPACGGTTAKKLLGVRAFVLQMAYATAQMARAGIGLRRRLRRRAGAAPFHTADSVENAFAERAIMLLRPHSKVVGTGRRVSAKLAVIIEPVLK